MIHSIHFNRHPEFRLLVILSKATLTLVVKILKILQRFFSF